MGYNAARKFLNDLEIEDLDGQYDTAAISQHGLHLTWQIAKGNIEMSVIFGSNGEIVDSTYCTENDEGTKLSNDKAACLQAVHSILEYGKS